MKKSKSYNQKAAAYWSIIKANPSISANAIGRKYSTPKGAANHPLSMKKQDRNDLVKSLKQANIFRLKMLNSNAFPKTKDRTIKGIYQAAKHETRRYTRKYPLKPHQIRRTILQTISDTFGGNFDIDEYSEFYISGMLPSEDSRQKQATLNIGVVV